MMRQFELVEKVLRYNPQANEDLLNRAYVYAMKAHGSQVRQSGDPYFTHPLEVAGILTDLRVDDASVVAALLHDVIEDTGATREEIDRLFTPEIGELVEGLTKLKKLDLVSKRAEQAENLRKLLLAIASDVRVLLIKLADRLHNMRTLHHVPPAKRLRVAEETLEIYAPLAGRMGMQGMRDELEELGFCSAYPEAYQAINERLSELATKNAGLIETIESELSRRFAEFGVEAQVKGRQKRPYSVWRKMDMKSLSFEQLSDVYGFRVLVQDIGQCYQALGFVHTTWPMVPGRFKDYISTPKQNDYRSIHTTVIGPKRQRIELQIRTQDMHRIAEYGIAAHALYKDGAFVATGEDGRLHLNSESRAYEWLRHTVDMLSDGSNPEEFLEHTKLELFHDQVFCFTPKGRLIALPRGATPIDFAYFVHTDVGNTCVGCKVNGRTAPLVSQLQNGDEVEIITSRAQVPPSAWENIAVTGKARYEIRKATRAAVRTQYAGLGRTILKRVFERSGHAFSDEKLEAVLRRLARTSVEEVLAAVGRGEMLSHDVLKAVFPDWREERAASMPSEKTPSEGWFGVESGKGMKFKVPGQSDEEAVKVSLKAKKSAIPIRGIKGDLPVRFAPNGGAVPGDRIVGILTPGDGITIYPIHSPQLSDFEDRPELWLDVRWDMDDDRDRRFPARILLYSVNEPGTLAQIATVIAENDGNIDRVQMERRSPDFTQTTIDLEVWDLKHLNAILSQLRTKPVVSQAERVNG